MQIPALSSAPSKVFPLVVINVCPSFSFKLGNSLGSKDILSLSLKVTQVVLSNLTIIYL